MPHRRSHATIAVATLLAAMISLGGCQTTGSATTADEPVSLAAVNALCPMTASPIDPTVESVSYDGYEIGFCCSGCPAGWTRMPESRRAAFLSGYVD